LPSSQLLFNISILQRRFFQHVQPFFNVSAFQVTADALGEDSAGSAVMTSALTAFNFESRIPLLVFSWFLKAHFEKKVFQDCPGG